MDLVTLLNTIRDNASAEYQARIPVANRTNMEQIRYAMLDGENVAVANEFMNNLINKIVKTTVINKIFKNPLKPLKKGKKPTGDTVEEIYNNFIKGDVPDFTGASLLERKKPDTKTLYHRMNHQMTYTVTVSPESLTKAFQSYDSLESYIRNIIATLHNSAELDEYMNMKEIMNSAITKNAIVKHSVPDPLTSETNGREFIKAVKTISGLMQFPRTDFNAYTTAQTVDTVPVTTFSRKNEQILILDTATDTSVNVDVLASLFNMSVAEFNDTRKIVIDCFPDASIRGMLVDEEFFQIFDDLITVKSFENPKGIYTNYYLHVWQTMAYSILVNAVAFVVGDNA